MRLSKQIKIQLAIFVVIALAAMAVMAVNYLQVPTLLFGAGHYQVTVQLPESAGLAERGNVTYLGDEVGRVDSVRFAGSGVEAVLSLDSDIKIPSNVQARVHSMSAIGEQYVELVPRDATSPPLRGGDVIPVADTTVPADINTLLDATSRGLQAIPGDNLQTVIDQTYVGIGGLGPELSRIVNAATVLSAGARQNIDSLTALIDKSPAVLDSQTQTADALHNWATNLASVTDQLRRNDASVSSLLPAAAGAAAEGKALFDRLQPTVPILMANLASTAEVALVYQPNIEQLLVLLPANIANVQGSELATRHQNKYRSAYIQLALNLNLPPTCQTGFLPASQQRSPTMVDSPDRIAGDLYCRVPQDSPFNVRGARNIPCETKPWKRAPTVAMCESDQDYVPLNNGYNWKGDPNATLSGQDVPQLSPATSSQPQAVPQAAPPPGTEPPIAIANYDPATGSYVGPDGKVYTQADLARPRTPTWESMLLPPS